MYEKKQVVVYKDNMCIIKDIVPTHLGFSTYLIENVDTGAQYTVGKHCISPLDFLEMDESQFSALMSAIGTESEVKNQSDEVLDVHVPSTSTATKRHVDMSDAEIDELARKRLCQNTDKQTQWAVSLLKG